MKNKKSEAASKKKLNGTRIIVVLIPDTDSNFNRCGNVGRRFKISLGYE